MNQSETHRIEQIRGINERWSRTAARDHDEESTIRDFIYPLLRTLGWNLATDLKREINGIDCVLYSEGKPHIGIEAKSLSYGTLDENKDSVVFNKSRLIENCRNIGIKRAVLTRYIETIIYDVESGEKIAFFNHPNEYIDKLEVLKLLQKPSP